METHLICTCHALLLISIWINRVFTIAIPCVCARMLTNPCVCACLQVCVEEINPPSLSMLDFFFSASSHLHSSKPMRVCVGACVCMCACACACECTRASASVCVLEICSPAFAMLRRLSQLSSILPPWQSAALSSPPCVRACACGQDFSYLRLQGSIVLLSPDQLCLYDRQPTFQMSIDALPFFNLQPRSPCQTRTEAPGEQFHSWHAL